MIVNNTYINNVKPPKYIINGHTVRSMYYNGELVFHHVPCIDIKLNVHELVLTPKGKYNLKVTLVPADCNEEITIRSTNTNVATINSDKVIIPNNEGDCDIEVKCGSKTAICKVHVKSENIILYNQGTINNNSEFGQFKYPSHSNFALQQTQMFIQIPGSGSSYGAAWFSWANNVEISEYDELQIYTTNPNDHSSVIGITRNTVANQAGYKIGLPAPIDTNDFIGDRTIVTLAQSSGSKQHKLDMDLIGGENGYLGLYFKRLESGDSVSEHILIDKILVVRKNAYVIGSGEDLSEDVNVPCTGVDFPQDELVLNYDGQTITYDLNSILNLTPSNTDEQKIWAMIESDNTVSVNSNGILTITGNGHGHVQLIVGNHFDNIRIKVTSTCKGISLDKSNISISDIDSSDTITAILTPSYTTDEVTWTVSNSNIATINGNGTTCVVTAKANGSCTITATCGSKSATCNVTVSVACRDITFDIDSLTIGINTGTYNVAQYVNVTPISCQLPVTWHIDKTSIATIDSNGIITPKGVGNCTLTATCGGKSVTLPVYIEAEPIEILIDTITIEVDETYDATRLYELRPGYNVQYKYTSIISIQNHIITGEEVGTTNLEIICDGIIKNVTVHVIAPSVVKCTSISVSPTSMTVNEGDFVAFYSDISVSVQPSNCTQPVTFGTGNSDVMSPSIAAEGVYQAWGEGTTTLTAYCGGKSATCTVTVVDPSTVCTGINVWATPSNTIKVGEEVYINVDLIPSTCTENYTISVSGSAIGENGYAGLYIGQSVGTSTVTVRCGSVSKSITIYVTN